MVLQYLEICRGAAAGGASQLGVKLLPSALQNRQCQDSLGRGSVSILFPETGLPQPSQTRVQCKSDKSEHS